MFTREYTIRHTVHATRMKDTNSSTVKKALDKVSIKISAMVRENIQNHER